MSKLKVTLVKQNKHIRFYRLSHRITKCIHDKLTNNMVIDIIPLQIEKKQKDVKEEYKELYPENGFDFICIHKCTKTNKTLVHGAFEYQPNKLTSAMILLDCGSNKNPNKPDYVFIRRLAYVNNLKFEIKDVSTNIINGFSFN